VTAPQEAGGSGSELWLDMSRYPDTDPDTVLTADQHGLLTDALAVDDASLPDAVFEAMLAVVTGDTADDDTADDDTADDLSGDTGDVAWSDDPAHAFGTDHHADPVDDPAHDPDPGHEHDPGHDGHGGWV
jgi:hypothetical protein